MVPGTTAFALGFGVGAFAVVAHIAGDALTPMGVRPFSPFSDARYSLDLVRDGGVATVVPFG